MGFETKALSIALTIICMALFIVNPNPNYDSITGMRQFTEKNFL